MNSRPSSSTQSQLIARIEAFDQAFEKRYNLSAILKRLEAFAHGMLCRDHDNSRTFAYDMLDRLEHRQITTIIEVQSAITEHIATTHPTRKARVRTLNLVPPSDAERIRNIQLRRSRGQRDAASA